MVDWRLARSIAGRIAGDPGLPLLAGDLAELCADGEQRVVAYTQLRPAAALPAPELVDRPTWLDANLAIMRTTLDPVVDRLTPSRKRTPGTRGSASGRAMDEAMKAAAGLVVSAEVGGLVGLMAQRVLGQYDVSPVDPDGPARLLFVAPNLRDAAIRLDVDERSLLHWVALHELTHAVQFASVPWLRGHVAALTRELLETIDVRLRIDLGSLRAAIAPAELRDRLGRLRDDGLLTAVIGAERRAVLDRVQATMALIEGHAEHVMDGAGVEAIDDLDQLRAALDRRRRERSGAWRIVERLLGLELKIRQYEVGKRFCDAVVAEHGIEGLNRAWDGPGTLPSWAELEDPRAWVARVAGEAQDAA
jgi:coenzyme F420 biosynthesis associated uncharacterized protein